MNRHERRAAEAKGRKLEVGSMIYTMTIRAVLRDGTTALYWIEVPEGMTKEQALKTQEWHGPFKTEDAAELVALAPDVVLAVASATTGPLLQATGAVPIVFVQVAEPVGAGFVQTLARPGGNATGFMLYEYGIGGKWLELLKEIAPGVKRVGFLQSLAIAAGPGQFGAIQASAPSLGVEVRPINARDASESERVITSFARPANGGLIVAGGAARRVGRRGRFIAIRSSSLRPGTGCPRSTRTLCSPLRAACSPMGLTGSISSDARPVTSIASSRARSQPTCQYRHRPNTSW